MRTFRQSVALQTNLRLEDFVGNLKTSTALGLFVASSFVLAPTIALANPLNAVVTTGSASVGTTANTTTVTQTSEGVVIDWSSFNVGKGETTTFVQPNAQAIAVNRIGGASASEIMGTLDANGKLVLINGNGLLFGAGSQVDVGSLVATASNAGDSDALAGKFTKGGSTNASVVNNGTITASQGGLVALVGPSVSNSGTINAKLGTVALGAANKFTVDFTGDGLVSFAARGLANASVTNTGALSGANVSMTARTAEGVATGVVNTGGTIAALGADNKGGTITLDAGAGGAVNVSGALDASGAAGGGKIIVGGSTNALASSVTIASGATLSADATQSGSGGRIHIDSRDATDFAGAISAQGAGKGGHGGLVEVSSHGTLGFTGTADLHSALADAGTIVLDPRDYFINTSGLPSEAGASAMSVATLEGLLAGGNVEIETSAGGTQTGNIWVDNGFTWNSAHNLELKAIANIEFEPGVAVSGTGTGNVTMVTDDLGTQNGGTVYFNGGATLSLTGGGSAAIYYDTSDYAAPNNYGASVSVTGGGALTAFMQVSSMSELQEVSASGSLAGDYALTRNINAVGTSYTPIAFSGAAYFTGIFDGEGHTISNLTIDDPNSDYVGLIGLSVGTVENLNLTGGTMTGYAQVGSLIGLMGGGLVKDCTSSVTVNGYANTGGLIGNENSGLVEYSSATGDVSSSGYEAQATGGLVGMNNTGTILHSFATGNVTAPEANSLQAGGLVGWQNEGTIENSYATGTVTGDQEVGGLVGADTNVIANSWASGDVHGAIAVGGLAGEIAQVTVERDFATGTVYETGGGYYVGGFVGEDSGEIKNSYETGNVEPDGASDAGGFVGLLNNDADASIIRSYATGSVSFGAYAFAGSDTGLGARFLHDYWDTSNENPGITGDPAASSQITGLTTTQLQSGLPAGLDATIWGSNPTINNGLPYLLTNVPP
jgi:filamentous hemagglutinin family protein